MNSRFLEFFASLAALAALAMPGRLCAQEQQGQDAEKPRYKLVYLDTLGGPTSGISCCGILPSVLNDQGTAVGVADTDIPNPNFAIENPIIPPDPYVNVAVAWQSHVPIKLPVLPGGYNSFANAISNTGFIPGDSETGEIDPVLGVVEVHPALWFQGQVIDLHTFGGGEGSASQANDWGQVVGFAQNDIPDAFGYFFFPTQSRAFLWQNGFLKDLGTLGGNDAQAIFVNDRGQIAGISYLNSIPVINSGAVCTMPGQYSSSGQPIPVPQQDPFLWENDKIVDLGNLGGNCAAPAAINIFGQVAGNSDVSDPSANPHAFLWTRETGIRDLGTLGGTFSQADDLTDFGQVVGAATNEGDQAFYAFLWKDNVMTNLGILPGDCYSSAYSINRLGQVVGDSWSCGFITRPFLWQNGQIFGFNIVPPPGTQLIRSEPASINDRGEIVGYASLNTGNLAFMLVPCDPVEPCDDVTIEVSAPSSDALLSTSLAPAATNQPGVTPAQKLALLRAQSDRRHHIFQSKARAF
jgi:probable HAF family extracellular repeat protein